MTRKEIKRYWWKKSRMGFIHKVLVMMGIVKSPTLEQWMMWGIPASQITAGMMNLYRSMK